MNNFQKAQKKLTNDMLVLFILQVMLIILLIINGQSFPILKIFYTILLFFGYNLSKQGKRAAGTIGIFTGIAMMLGILVESIIDFALGILVLMHALSYNKNF